MIGKTAVQIGAAAAGMVPMIGIGLWMYVIRDEPMTIDIMLLGPLIGGGGMIFWLLFLHLIVCRDSLDSLGIKGKSLLPDIGIGACLGAAQLVFHMLAHQSLARLFPPQPPAEEIIRLIDGLSRNLWLMLIWLGPVVWVGVALFEELWRVFTLRRLWSVWRGPAGKWVVITAVSILFGLAHGYQGPASVVSIAIQSVAIAWVFLATGRLRALVIAHALYDSVQIVMAVVAVRQLM